MVARGLQSQHLEAEKRRIPSFGLFWIIRQYPDFKKERETDLVFESTWLGNILQASNSVISRLRIGSYW